MEHLFKQMYSDEVANIKRQFTPRELTAAITIELIRRKMEEIEKQKGNPTYSTKTWRQINSAAGGTYLIWQKITLTRNKHGN